MQEIIITILIALLLLEAGEIILLSARNRKQRAQLQAKRIREGLPWDWTKESEKQAETAMEAICKLCREPYQCCEQAELEAKCAVCRAQNEVLKLAGMTEVRI